MSLGGNITLVYAGQQGSNILKKIKKVIAFSVPCDLGGCADELEKLHNTLYLKRFLFRLKRKIRAKHGVFPEIEIKGLNNIRTLTEFANRYTAPIHGFNDAKDYYSKCSSRYFIPEIRVPTLIVSALDDPFLSPSCYPYREAEENPFVTLETPDYGGHMGFMNPNSDMYWSEERLIDFIKE